MKYLQTTISLWLILLPFMPLTAFAQGIEGNKADGFSGKVELGAIWINSTDQLYSSDFFIGETNEKTDHLNDSADSFNAVPPLLQFDLRYAFHDSNNVVYLKKPLEYSFPGLTLGMVHAFSKSKTLDASISYEHKTIWEDPFITNETRNDTGLNKLGFALNFGINTKLDLWYKFNHGNVDQDLIGKRFKDLQRDGFDHSVGIGYKATLNRSNLITSKLELTQSVTEGKSNAYYGGKIEIGYIRMKEKCMIGFFVAADRKGYEKTHPIFNETRNDEEYSATGVFTLFKPFGFDRFYINFIAGYSISNSNIDFYDKRTYLGGISTGFRF